VPEPQAQDRGALFIALEGGEGSGKSTQARALQRWLKRRGLDSMLVTDPGGTALGRTAERWLKTAKGVPASTELLLFGAARSLLTSEVILPALRDGRIVISDRYAPSTVAYQGYGRGVDLQTIEEVNKLATSGLYPDLIVLLDIPPQTGISRKAKDVADRFHQETLSFHLKVRRGYLEMAEADPGRWFVVDATRARTIIFETIASHVAALLAAGGARVPSA